MKADADMAQALAVEDAEKAARVKADVDMTVKTDADMALEA